MILTRLQRNPFLDGGRTSIRFTIQEEQNKARKKALKKFNTELIRPGVQCRLAEIRDDLMFKGISQEKMYYMINDFREELVVKLDNGIFNLTIPLFPKTKRGRWISLTVRSCEVDTTLPTSSSPESIADFILAIEQWIPEYMAIEERVTTEEKQRKMAYDIAYDVFSRTILEMLKEKGYSCETVHLGYDNLVSVNIRVSEVFSINLQVNLLEDFIVQVSKIVQALPSSDILH